MAVLIQRSKPSYKLPIEDIVAHGAAWGTQRRIHVIHRSHFGGVVDCIAFATKEERPVGKRSSEGMTYVCMTKGEAKEFADALYEMIEDETCPPSTGTEGLPPA